MASHYLWECQERSPDRNELNSEAWATGASNGSGDLESVHIRNFIAQVIYFYEMSKHIIYGIPAVGLLMT